jgi:hypothetical protein
MWKCSTCGEQIDDQFDSCWKCDKPNVHADGPERSRRKESPMGFWTYWRRGWFVLLLAALIGLFERFLWSSLAPWLHRNQGPYVLIALAVLLLVLPAFAYWLFVLFFGSEAYPFAKRASKSATARLREEPP